MNRVLFVDDEPNIIQGLQRVLRPLRNDWDMRFAGSGREALTLLEQSPCDAIVTDMRMPGMNGVELLAQVRARSPRTARFILSGQSEQALLRDSVRVAHQFLSKPCDFELLRDAVLRVGKLNELLPNAAVQTGAAQMAGLPCEPSARAELRTLIQTENVPIQTVGDLIARDMGMSAKVLQLVHSAFFGTPQRTMSVCDAVALLGMATISDLLAQDDLFPTLPEETMCALELCDIWTQSRQAADAARQSGASEEATLAALMQNVGKLIFACQMPEKYAQALALARDAHMPVADAERAVLGAPHAHAGAYLLGLWGLPAGVAEGTHLERIN